MCRFIILKEGDTCTPFEVRDIIRFEACGSYTNVYFINGTSSKQCGYLGDWQGKVKSSGLFVRIDRSHLVNYQQIISYSRAGGVLLKDKTTRLPLSVEGLIQLMGLFSL